MRKKIIHSILLVILFSAYSIYPAPSDSNLMPLTSQPERHDLDRARKEYEQGNIGSARSIWNRVLIQGANEESRKEILYYLAITDTDVNTVKTQLESLADSSWNSKWGQKARLELSNIACLEGDVTNALLWLEEYKDSDPVPDDVQYASILMEAGYPKKAIDYINSMDKRKIDNSDHLKALQVESNKRIGKTRLAERLIRKYQGDSSLALDIFLYQLADIIKEDEPETSRQYLQQIVEYRKDSPVGMLAKKELDEFEKSE